MGLDLAGGAEVTPYSYEPQQMAMAAPGSATTAGAAGLGAGALAGGATSVGHAPTSAPSAYSQPSQSQYGGSSSEHNAYGDYAAYAGYADPAGSQSQSTSPTSAGFPGGFHPAMGADSGVRSDFRHPSPGPSLSLPGTASSGSVAGLGAAAAGGAMGVLPSQKELEARGFRVSNNGEGGSGYVQHTDAGRLDATPEEGEPQAEIPPSYDSIRR